MERLRSLILAAVLATIPVTTIGFQCQNDGICNCQISHDGDYELHCKAEANSAFVLNIDPGKYVQVQCHNSPNWTNFRYRSAEPLNKAREMYFKMCDLPEEPLVEVARKVGVEDPEIVVFRSYGSLSSTLKSDHLRGLENAKKVVLSSNGLTELPVDLLDHLPNLTSLDLRENNVASLPAGIFKKTGNLRVLEVGNNDIEYLAAGTFAGLRNLTLLNLWRNQLKGLEPGLFDDLVSLRSLDVNSNLLTSLPEGIFDNLADLRVLNLFGNNFSSLPDGLLRNNTRLTMLNLFNNRRNLTALPRRLLQGLGELKEARFSRSGLSFLHEDTFWGAAALRNLSLESNFLEKMPELIFRDLSELRTLDLNYNELRFLPERLFVATNKLERINLSRNHLSSISGPLFSGLTSLRVLEIERNDMIEISAQAFTALRELRIARFSHNSLTLNSSLKQFQDEFGTRSPFHYCDSLEELYLAHNNISEMYADWVVSSPQLRVLDLRYNQIPFITTADVQFVSENIKVDLRYNNISHVILTQTETLAEAQNRTTPRNVVIKIEENPLACDCFLYDFLRYLDGELRNAQALFSIDPGNLTCKSPRWLEGMPLKRLHWHTLKCAVKGPEFGGYCPKGCECWIRPYRTRYLVDCSFVNLRQPPERIGPPKNYNIELNLTGNFLKETPSMDLPGYEQVAVLSLSHNNISRIPLETLPTTLEVLELHNNNLTRVDGRFLEALRNSSLKKLTLDKNPWRCDCEARDFLNFIQAKFTELPELLKISCGGENVPMSEMTINELCPAATGVVLGISLTVALTGLIVGVLAALYYRYQREVKVWLYAHQLFLWFVTEDELDKDKRYDAFISYSHKDEDFVVNELVSRLEDGPRPFKLCLHFRDWLAGEWIPTQIARSVDDSRRTVVVLSPNFLESVWGRMEFRAAHSQALSEGRARVIVVLYGDIGPTENLDPELKAYLSMNTYVKWGDPWFWDKLRYALPHPPELTKKRSRGRIFEKQRPHEVNVEKKDLVGPQNAPTTPPAQTTPPADSIKSLFADGNLKNGCILIESYRKENPSLNGGVDYNKPKVDDQALKILPRINKMQCTTV
ncbi:protein toll [Orussus abietinus]|uniref:protein toll n=1 Tax=Orussus abietinus TaxID=222816 RepID=UPI0006257DAC|nr:protein toll [Orussus abietinus]